MLRHPFVASCLAVLLLVAASVSLAAPRQLSVEYELLQQGISIGSVKDQLTVTGNKYQIDSLAEGKGIYKLMGERTLSSQGDISGNTLRPLHFESRQSRHPDKALVSDFDWAKKALAMQVKGRQQTEKLAKGTQDLLSIMYCWMWQAPKAKQIKLDVANGKKVSSHAFIVTEEDAPLETAAGSFKVIKLADSEGEKILYLAKEKGYLPVKLVVLDDGKRMEQVITRITGQ
ncbi:Protein of unknown function [Methylophilus rhizosphaerae]|uniref:DUF3108 domain-containing protein n=1 Tax=Methylophilus rhizosphaerae TaxID=492660 RepID=A0A1G9CHU6_9PROT|nr:DUF3108 domain-containing protein [Methylophilus rhizosphaerae]SDK51209.1 Protein of unknown function [Methylophilus rhizosphaerae]